MIATLVKDRLGHKYHWAVADYLQRAARHLASRTDVEHAYAVGRAGVELALAGNNAVMPAIIRTSDKPYRWKIGVAPLEKVANVEKMLPRDYISADGLGITAKARAYLARRGATIPHFEAWLSLRGLRTLALRMARHSSNAAAVAAFLAQEPSVERVHHPSRSDHPQHDLAARLYRRGTGGIVAFDLRDGAPAVRRFLKGHLQTIAIVHSLGEVATTISYPTLSSHRMLPAETRRALGVGEGTIRISVGVEDPGDITRDLARAFAGLRERVRA